MADENNDIVEGQDPVIETPASNEPAPKEYSDVEQRALAQGWVPKEEWDGHGKWRDAEEFLERGELFANIDEKKRRLERVERTLEDFKKHHKMVRETAYKQALADLKAEKREALETGDAARVIEIDDKITETREAAAQAAREPITAPELVQPNPHYVAWMNRNGWYTREPAMKIFADLVGQELANAGERNPTKILEEVERRVKKEFSHKFNNPNRDKPGSVEGGGSKGKSQTKDTFTLTPEETQVMKRFTTGPNPVMTKEEYIAELKAMRGA